MALLFFEGFDNYIAGVTAVTYGGGAAGSPGVYNIALEGGHAFPAGTLGGQKMQVNGSGRYLIDTTQTNTAGIIWGVRFTNNFAGTSQNVFVCYDTAGTVQFYVSINSAGRLYIARGPNVTLATATTTLFILGCEYYIELKASVGNSAAYEIRVNGVTELSGTDDLQASALANWRYVAVNPGNNTIFIDDIYLCDDTGSAPYNTFLGGSGAAFTGVRVETLFPTSNNSVQFTASTGSNFGTVDEAAMNSDTDYNSDATSGHIDTFNHGSLVSTVTSILAAKVVSFARKEDISVKQLRNKMISGGTTSNGATRNLTTVYQNQETYFNNDPDTAAAWANATAINNTKIGYEAV